VTKGKARPSYLAFSLGPVVALPGELARGCGLPAGSGRCRSVARSRSGCGLSGARLRRNGLVSQDALIRVRQADRAGRMSAGCP
jgi:hypothetical protein